ncbi:hypothetical protein [Pedobacter frigoris]|uniref:hypothetical protein n=1 Tax=Pedobacter frigoris TaxID=2571272 RepID=UPI00292E51BE|nr:hypothetical protein [Pedobacter frigoris]
MSYPLIQSLEILMKTDKITEIGIDGDERLYVVPEKEQFSMIWRSASEVHWNADLKCLYSPKPREWSYYQWYYHIIDVVRDEYGCKLSLDGDTKWINVPDQVRSQIYNDHL